MWAPVIQHSFNLRCVDALVKLAGFSEVQIMNFDEEEDERRGRSEDEEGISSANHAWS